MAGLVSRKPLSLAFGGYHHVQPVRHERPSAKSGLHTSAPTHSPRGEGEGIDHAVLLTSDELPADATGTAWGIDVGRHREGNKVACDASVRDCFYHRCPLGAYTPAVSSITMQSESVTGKLDACDLPSATREADKEHRPSRVLTYEAFSTLHPCTYDPSFIRKAQPTRKWLYGL